MVKEILESGELRVEEIGSYVVHVKYLPCMGDHMNEACPMLVFLTTCLDEHVQER